VLGFYNPLAQLGLDDETALNIPDSLTHEDIGNPINEGNLLTLLLPLVPMLLDVQQY
jgi:hypothetical protein